MALVASSNAPLLLFDGDLNIIAASTSFCYAFRIDPVTVPGRQLAQLGAGEWAVPQLTSLLKAAAAGRPRIEAYEMNLGAHGHTARCLALNAQSLDYGAVNGDASNVRLLLTISDVTEAKMNDRIKADLLAEKEFLLQELQHRVANSLQIIASVLMQSAKRVQSEETRTHLHDAHHRVMSIASLQKQLTVSHRGDIALRSYFRDLCQSIGASMIRDHNQLQLDTQVDESVVTADMSMSLGLIVTELVINALKHAFPDHRSGRIIVKYNAHGEHWVLSVGDNGAGMENGGESPKPGLGTSIVSALAKQLGADVRVRHTRPGTEISVNHKALTSTVASDGSKERVTVGPFLMVER